MLQGLFNFATAKVLSSLYSFKSSLLFYPALLATGSVVLFIITSRIDESLEQVTVDLPVLDSLLFAGSPDAARSILSTIAAGWATILGVAFSVTLISLQLSITKHTSEVVDEFENDKLNQVMLGWFVSTVIYSLLILKTVRTEGDGSSVAPFAPVIGVNIAVFLAVIALFIFVAFLHNVSTYLKPPLLTKRIKNHIINSLKQYDERQIDRSAAFVKIKSTGEKLIQIRSPQEGVLRRIKLDSFPTHVDAKDSKIWVEFSAKVGDYVKRGSVVANVYAVSGSSHEQSNGQVHQHLEKSIASSLDVSKNRDVLTDPSYGIEILRNIAIKSINQSEINSIQSCVSGLFEILGPAFRIKDLQANAFRVPSNAEHQIIFDLKEEPVFEIALSELAMIYKACLSEGAISLAAIPRQYVDGYRLLAMDLLDSNMADEFEVLTKWYSNLLLSSTILLDEMAATKSVLREFRQDLKESHPYALDGFDVHMRKMLVSEA